MHPYETWPNAPNRKVKDMVNIIWGIGLIALGASGQFEFGFGGGPALMVVGGIAFAGYGAYQLTQKNG